MSEGRDELKMMYGGIFDKLHASDGLREKVINAGSEPSSIKSGSRRKGATYIKAASAVAACLAVFIICSAIFGTGGKNSFVLTASASELGGEATVEMAAIRPVGGSSGNTVSGEDEEQHVTANVPFMVECRGKNISSVTYTIKNGSFVFPFDTIKKEFEDDYRRSYPNEARITDSISAKKAVGKDKWIYSVYSGMTSEGYGEYSSYTIDYGAQSGIASYSDMPELFPIDIVAGLSSKDDISENVKSAFSDYIFGSSGFSDYALGSDDTENERYAEDVMQAFKMIYDEMFGRVTVRADVTFNDGTTDSKTMSFSCMDASEEGGIVIGARIVDEGGRDAA